MEPSLQNRDEFDRIGSNLLLSDADLALTLIRIATDSSDPEKKRVTLGRARRAYDSICESLTIVRMAAPDLAALGIKLKDIKAALEAMEPPRGAA